MRSVYRVRLAAAYNELETPIFEVHPMLLPVLVLLASRIQPADVSVPYRQPQLAAGDGQVAMVFGGGSAIYFAASADKGKTFGTPVKVAELGALALGRHRGPRLAIVKQAMVISAVVGESKAQGEHAHGLPAAGNLAVWRSTDRGVTWKLASTINDVPASAREGLHAMVAGRDGSIFAAWLDLREKGTQLWGSRSVDGGLTWKKNVLVHRSPEGTICQCCHPSLLIDESGRIFAMWRNTLDGSRDLYLASSTDGEHFSTAQKLGTGTWKLNACPMDGGALAIDHGHPISAWRRDGEIFTTDAAGAEKKVGTGKDVTLAVGKRGTYLAWTQDGTVQVLSPKAAAPVKVGEGGGFATLLALPDGGMLAAWEANGSVETKRLD